MAWEEELKSPCAVREKDGEVPEPEPAPAPSPSSRYQVSIDRSTGTKLGINVLRSEGKSLLINSITGGLFGEWNRSHPDRPVKVGDCIVEINGEKGDALRLRDECKKAIMLHMQLEESTVELYKISIDRSSGMKLGIIVRQDGEALLLNAVTGGLFQKWNRENPDRQVEIGDRIVEINGHQEAPSLSEECKKDKVLNITIMKAQANAVRGEPDGENPV